MSFYRRYRYAQLFGDLYRARLALEPREVTWLNKFDPPSHAFIQVEAAREATVRLFVAVMNDLEQRCKKAGTTLARSVKELATNTDAYAYSHRPYRYVNRFMAGHKVGAAVYLTIFQHCENAVRERYGYKLFDADIYYSEDNDPERLFNQYFGDAVHAQLPALASVVPPPTDGVERALNQADPARWKAPFEQLLTHLPANPAGFVAGLYALGQANDLNPTVSAIYLEAARQLGALDREATVGFYLHYLYYGARRYPFKPKPLLKRLQKHLFPLPEHLPRFEALTQELLRTKQLAAALDAVPGIYYKERRKIALDPAAVHAARAQHASTVELLNEYLRDEPAPGTSKPAPTPAKPAKTPAPKATPAARKATKTPKAAKAAAGAGAAPAPAAATFAPGLALTEVQRALLHLFAARRLALTQAEVEAFARQHSVLRNQLIDGFNEACAELLDDVLIEESGDGYAIYQPYFQKITT